jgi:hypothetical protein
VTSMNGFIKLPSTSHAPGRGLTQVGCMASSAHRLFVAWGGLAGQSRVGAGAVAV